MPTKVRRRQDRVDRLLQALAEPHRREILLRLRHGERSAGELAAGFDLTRPAVSQHLRTLREAGLVTYRREGTRRLYRLRPEALEDLRRFLETFWEDRLHCLKAAAEAEQRRKEGRRGR